MSIEIFEKLKTVESVPENLAYVSIHTSTECTAWKSSMLIPQNIFRTTNPENFSSVE